MDTCERHASDATVETAKDDTPGVTASTATASSVSAGGSSGTADSLPVVRNLSCSTGCSRYLLVLINLTHVFAVMLNSLELMTT